MRSISSLSAFNSFSPVGITEEDLRRLVTDEDIDPSFAGVVASFGTLPRASELGYCCMSTRTEGDGSYSTAFRTHTPTLADFKVDLSYLLRYAEQDGQHWKIRQLGVYHAYSEAENSHFWVLIHAHPPADDALSRTLIHQFSNLEGCASFNACPDMLHALIFDTYISKWRWYLEFLGNSYSELVDASQSRIFHFGADAIRRMKLALSS